MSVSVGVRLPDVVVAHGYTLRVGWELLWIIIRLRLAGHTEQKIEQEIAEGKLGIARDRLHGLVVAYPSNLSFRSRLGDVYWRLGYPVEAGRWWFLDDSLTPEKQGAIDLFIRRWGGDPLAILRQLKLRAHPDDLTVEEARSKIAALVAECEARGLKAVSFPTARVETKATFAWWTVGCWAAFILFAFLLVVGAGTVLHWFAGGSP